jgi:UDP:flavonoid glycosyltransferase YjiC (YdhE family)
MGNARRIINAMVQNTFQASTPAKRIKVLMFAEAVTLAHLARPLCLAACLDPLAYEVVVACDPRYAKFACSGHWGYVELTSISSQQFLRALALGTPPYDFSTLQSYMQQDMVLMQKLQPDVVLGDFRLSLSVSCRRLRIPYMALSNAYWSPSFAASFPLPVLPMTRMLPLPWATYLFNRFGPLAFAAHCRPLNRLRKHYGLPSFEGDLRRAYTDADHLLIADSAAAFPMDALPHRQSFIGPLTWSPAVALPAWWHEAVLRPPIVYVTLGSSGPPAALQQVLNALEGLPLCVIASSAGAPYPKHVPANAFVADYLPGQAATARASLVVCNGGSLTTQQALASGVPVLGIASNMDQFMNMQGIESLGAGKVLRADRLSHALIRTTCQELLQSPACRFAAIILRDKLAQGPLAATVFETAVNRVKGLACGRPQSGDSGNQQASVT